MVRNSEHVQRVDCAREKKHGGTMMMRSDIISVVVTYNRKEMLEQCLAALRKQSCRADILVIDNCSTDGTAEYLDDQPDVTAVHMPENTGGAGGFCEGIRQAVRRGYQYIWLMDDDCLPEETALEALVRADRNLDGNYGWLSSRCLWTDGTLCPMNLQRKTPFRDIEVFDRNLVPAQMASFVSLFIRRDTVQTYGLPIAEFVIWSDDWEYTRRISRSVPCYAVRDSVVTHAMKSKTVVNIATDSEDRISRYIYFYRNDVVLYRREGIRGWLWLLAKDSWHAAQSVAKGHPKRIRTITAGFCRGVTFQPEIEKVTAYEDNEQQYPD